MHGTRTHRFDASSAGCVGADGIFSADVDAVVGDEERELTVPVAGAVPPAPFALAAPSARFDGRRVRRRSSGRDMNDYENVCDD